MYPCEEDNRVSDKLVEVDVLVELDDAVEGRLSQQRDQRPADGENKDGDVEMEDQSSGACYRIGRTKRSSSGIKIVLEMIVEEAESEDHSMDDGERCQKEESRPVVGRPTIYLFHQP